MAKKNETTCFPMHSTKCMGVKMIVLGILVVLNAIYGWLSWGVFIGGVIAIKGIMMLLHPKC